MHDGFAAKIEGSVHDDGNSGAFAEFVDEAIVKRIDFFFDGLRTGAAIDVSDRRNHAAFFGTHLRGENHERRIVSGFEIFGRGFFFEGGSKGAPPFAEFDGVVDLGIHLGIARIGKDGAAAERAGAKLHAALIPARIFP